MLLLLENQNTMLKLVHLAFLVPMFALYSCCKEVSCEMGGLDLMITNLSPNAVDTINIKTFKKNSNFSTLIADYNIYFDQDTNSVLLQNYRSKYPVPGYLLGDYDYQIVTKNHVYEIREMIDSPTSTRYCRHHLVWATCYTVITELQKNGVAFHTNGLDYLILENWLFSQNHSKPKEAIIFAPSKVDYIKII